MLRAFVNVLEQIEVAVCVFDDQDRTVLWNNTFLSFFPEHAGHVHVGEHYRENLRRFYRLRLPEQEAHMLERYVEEGIARHRAQQQAFEFDHCGYRVRAASLEWGSMGRIRVWRKTVALESLVVQEPVRSDACIDAADVLENLADGALVVGQDDCILWANKRFHSLYGLPFSMDVRGWRFDALYQAAWQGTEPSESHLAGLRVLQERQRFSGAPYELPLPDQRWVRVLEQNRTRESGQGYSTHVDITAFKRQQEALERLSLRLELLAITDALTGLANRRRLDEALKNEWQRAHRDNACVSLILIDVDNFKQINDAYGHPYGDEVLKALAQLLTQHADRAGSLIARYGGEEFAVLLPGGSLEEAHALAERLRSQAQALALNLDGEPVAVTISCGVSCAVPARLGGVGDYLVEQADAALYQAKRAGRNRVVGARL